MRGRRGARSWSGWGFALVLVSGLVLGACTKESATPPPVSGTSVTGAPAATTAAPRATVPFKLQQVDVEGHKMGLACKGSGSPTVIFAGDIGQDASQSWAMSKVPDGLAGDATVCVYDRPGLGQSEAATTPRSIANHVKELNGLITAAGIKPPVYLVGQGFGTLIVRQYAKDNRVAGMVLLDPPLWGLDLKTPDNATPGVKAEYDYLPELNRDLALYGAGALPPGPIPLVVLGVDGTKPPLPDNLVGDAAPLSPTTTVFPAPDAEKRQTEQRTLGQKSPFGKFEEVPNAGSYLQYWSPDTVIAAVKKVLTDKQ